MATGPNASSLACALDNPSSSVRYFMASFHKAEPSNPAAPANPAILPAHVAAFAVAPTYAAAPPVPNVIAAMPITDGTAFASSL